MSIKVIQVNPIICPTPDIDTVNIVSLARQERVCADMSPVVLCIPQGVQGAQGPQGPQGIQGPAGPQGAPGQGVPSGGDAGQVLAKIDGTDYNTEWVDQSGEVTYQESVTYVQLVAKIGASELVPGLRYLITDFATAYYHTDGGVPINDPQYAAVEPIVVTAITANSIASLAFSTVHPSDVLYYDWDADNWTSDAFYSIGGTIIPGWKGVISRRIDTVNNLEHTCDFRGMTFREYSISARAYNSARTYNIGDVASLSNELYFCRKNDVIGVSPTNTKFWHKFLGGANTSTNQFWSKSSFGLSFQFADAAINALVQVSFDSGGSFNDFPAFAPGCKNCKIIGRTGYSAANTCIKSATSGATIFAKDSSFGFADYAQIGIGEGVFATSCVSLVAGNGCSSLFIGNASSYITLKDQSNNIVIGSASSNLTISGTVIALSAFSSSANIESGAVCDLGQVVGLTSVGTLGYVRNYGLISGCKLSPDCSNNLFEAGAYSSAFGLNMQGNTFASNVQSSSFGDDMQGNVFAGVFACNILNSFQRNTFNSDISDISGGANFTDDDYSSATEVYQPGAKTLLINRNGDKRLQYVDASDNIVIVSNLA